MATSEWKTDGIGHTSDERETTDILIDLTMKPMHESKSIGATTPEETHHHFPQCLRACFVGTHGVAYDTSEETRVVFV